MVKELNIIDIKDMVGFNPKVTNGISSVSEGKVFFGKCAWMPDYALETICCKKHGAMLCVSEDRKIWRCPECNEGCYVKRGLRGLS